jgi:hypothetical protein
MIKRRLDFPEPNQCLGGRDCPAVLEMEGGDFAVIGTDITSELTGNLPSDCGCGPGERIIRVPRKTLVSARAEIPAN